MRFNLTVTSIVLNDTDPPTAYAVCDVAGYLVSGQVAVDLEKRNGQWFCGPTEFTEGKTIYMEEGKTIP